MLVEEQFRNIFCSFLHRASFTFRFCTQNLLFISQSCQIVISHFHANKVFDIVAYVVDVTGVVGVLIVAILAIAWLMILQFKMVIKEDINVAIISNFLNISMCISQCLPQKICIHCNSCCCYCCSNELNQFKTNRIEFN